MIENCGRGVSAGATCGLAFAAAAVAPSLPDSLILEQALLWTFACGWLLATSLHLRQLAGNPRISSQKAARELGYRTDGLDEALRMVHAEWASRPR